MKKIYNKLVRNLIPKKIIDNNEKPIYRVLNDKEFKEELIIKLFEEATEVKDASNEEIIEECGDVLTVVFAIAKVNGVNEEELLNIMREKDIRRGNFDERIYLESVD